MPGGGVGLFNGKPSPFLLPPSPLTPFQLHIQRKTRILTRPFTACTDQYGAPPNGWGARYGGVSSKSECESFPEALKAGCNWRFDWYVSPLTTSSGCSYLPLPHPGVHSY